MVVSFFYFHPYLGKIIHFDYCAYFSDGLVNQPPTSEVLDVLWPQDEGGDSQKANILGSYFLEYVHLEDEIRLFSSGI